MNLKKIIIYEYDVLFNILDEIKENLRFEFIKANKTDFDLKENFLKSDYLVISKSPQGIFRDQLIIKDTPLKINKLIEIINLKFLKKQFNLQSDIWVGPYKLNLNSREISKDNQNIDLTEREINLILFLKKAKHAVKIDELQKEVWGYSVELETHTVETHIHRLRKKIKDKFEDENVILSTKKGYLIEKKK